MVLIEREEPLAALDEAARATRQGRGPHLALVSGDAGAGKTAVVRAFVESRPRDVLVVVGGCERLRTPRPLGPLLDWARDHDAALTKTLTAEPSRTEVFEAALGLLTRQPTVAVVEDAHWADEATLDLLNFLGRRLRGSNAVLVVTYRADEVGRDHPLSIVLGDLATERPVRIQVAPLTLAGVTTLAEGHDVDPVHLHERTGGNPFFVTECLSGDDDAVPSTVRQAVLARAARLTASARHALDRVSVVPGRMEPWLAAALADDGGALDECVARGVLVADHDRIRFRHELAREAVLDAVLPDARRRIHTRALEALADPPEGTAVDHARVTHHAEACGDVTAVVRHAPEAAAAAAAAGARREAAAHLELALRHQGRYGAAERFELWFSLAEQRTVLGRHDEAIEAYEQAVAVAASLGDDQRRGFVLAHLWSPLSMAGEIPRAMATAKEAVATLEGRFPGPALALAYAQVCSQHMLARELALAERWGRKAIALAEEHDDQSVRAYALIQSGVALWMGGDPLGLARLEEGVAVARAHDLSQLVAQGLSQIGSGGGEIRQYAVAVPALDECVAYAERHELGGRGLYAEAWRARCQLDLGRWEAASPTLSRILRSPRCHGITRMTALTALGRLRARRGDPDVWRPLHEALDLARHTGHLQRMWPVVAARAEAAWLEGRLVDEVGNVEPVFEVAVGLEYPWAVGELGFWLWRGGVIDDAPGGAVPYVLHMAGDVTAAAAAWSDLGCVYDEAVARADSDDDSEQRRALDIFASLGAAPERRRLVERRRAAGRPAVRAPRPSASDHPRGLSDREVTVLRLVASGCTNAEIASRLHISPKTVGHHVSHVFDKLGVRSRAEAVAVALASGVPLAE